MKVTFVERKLDIKQGTKDFAEKKLTKLSKYFPDDTELRLTVSELKGKYRVEAIIRHKSMLYRADELSEDIITAVEKIESAMDRQIRKHRTKLEKHLREGAFTSHIDSEPVEEVHEFKIVRNKRLVMKPMSAEEAILQMNLLGHKFFIYSDAKTMETSIVYKRKEGDYGLIEVNGEES